MNRVLSILLICYFHCYYERKYTMEEKCMLEGKDNNMQVGRRLKEARTNLGYRQVDFAETLKVTEEHYRKYELGSTGLSANKLIILYQSYGIDPTYLLTGKGPKEFDVEYFIANCTKDQKEQFLHRIFAYLLKFLTK